jgi:hypothetical protein
MARGPTRIQWKNKDPRGWQEFVARLLELSSRGLVSNSPALIEAFVNREGREDDVKTDHERELHA